MSTYQKGTKHVETDKINDRKMASTLLTGRAFFRALLTWAVRGTGQHDFLPGFTCRTSKHIYRSIHPSMVL